MFLSRSAKYDFLIIFVSYSSDVKIGVSLTKRKKRTASQDTRVSVCLPDSLLNALKTIVMRHWYIEKIRFGNNLSKYNL